MTQPPALAVVVKGWPRLSETFIAQELVALEEAGLPLGLWSLRHPTDRKTHPLHDRLRAGVTYLPEYLHDEKARVIRSWRRARGLSGYAAARALYAACGWEQKGRRPGYYVAPTGEKVAALILCKSIA